LIAVAGETQDEEVEKEAKEEKKHTHQIEVYCFEIIFVVGYIHSNIQISTAFVCITFR